MAWEVLEDLRLGFAPSTPFSEARAGILVTWHAPGSGAYYRTTGYAGFKLGEFLKFRSFALQDGAVLGAILLFSNFEICHGR